MEETTQWLALVSDLMPKDLLRSLVVVFVASTLAAVIIAEMSIAMLLYNIGLLIDRILPNKDQVVNKSIDLKRLMFWRKTNLEH